MRILVVEDDFISRRLLCRYLEPYGECDVVSDGVSALRSVRHAIATDRHYDLICLDIMMPEMDGHETLREVRSIEAEQGIVAGEGARMIMTTALEDHASVMKAFRGHCDGYVVKPIEKKKLLQTLKDVGLPIDVAQPR